MHRKKNTVARNNITHIQHLFFYFFDAEHETKNVCAMHAHLFIRMHDPGRTRALPRDEIVTIFLSLFLHSSRAKNKNCFKKCKASFICLFISIPSSKFVYIPTISPIQHTITQTIWNYVHHFCCAQSDDAKNSTFFCTKQFCSWPGSFGRISRPSLSFPIVVPTTKWKIHKN